MDECKYTKFGLDVKMSLLKSGKTQNWLIEQVKEKTGMFFDDSYLYKILTGQRKAVEMANAIREILNLPENSIGSDCKCHE